MWKEKPLQLPTLSTGRLMCYFCASSSSSSWSSFPAAAAAVDGSSGSDNYLAVITSLKMTLPSHRGWWLRNIVSAASTNRDRPSPLHANNRTQSVAGTGRLFADCWMSLLDRAFGQCLWLLSTVEHLLVSVGQWWDYMSRVLTSKVRSARWPRPLFSVGYVSRHWLIKCHSLFRQHVCQVYDSRTIPAYWVCVTVAGSKCLKVNVECDFMFYLSLQKTADAPWYYCIFSPNTEGPLDRSGFLSLRVCGAVITPRGMRSHAEDLAVYAKSPHSLFED